jgi:hypothetical protein
MNFYVVSNYIEDFNMVVWGVDFLHAFIFKCILCKLYLNALLTFWCVGYIVYICVWACVLKIPYRT